MLSTQFNALFSLASARRVGLRALCLVVFIWLLAAPLRGMADNPPGAPPNTRIMLYTPSGLEKESDRSLENFPLKK